MSRGLPVQTDQQWEADVSGSEGEGVITSFAHAQGAQDTRFGAEFSNQNGAGAIVIAAETRGKATKIILIALGLVLPMLCLGMMWLSTL